jgi:hypothetical protein
MRKPWTLAVLPLLGACVTAAGTGAAEPGPEVTTTQGGFRVSMAGTQRTVQSEIGAPVAEVWAVLPAVMEEAGLPGRADPATRTVSTPPRTVRGRLQGQPLTRLVDCGRGEFGAERAASGQVRMIVRATVQPSEEGGSRLETVVEAHVRDSSGGANDVLAPCRSLGVLEEAIAELVRARLAG